MKEMWTELDDRVLRYDGVSIVCPVVVLDLLLRGVKPNQLRVLEQDEDIRLFNGAVADHDQIKEYANEPVKLKFDWQLPPEYFDLNVEEHVSVVFGERLSALAYSSTQVEAAINRVAQELAEFDRRGLTNLLRTIIYVLDKFKETGQVYGVGRGSSCASFVLFLLGLHVVDPIKYDIPLEEFMHD